MAMLALIASVVLAQAPMGPVKYPGSNETFYRTTLAVEEKLAKKDFYGAERAAKALPKRKVSIVWDDSAVPKDRRMEFQQARDLVIKDMILGLSPVVVDVAAKGDIKISFTDQLPNPDGGVAKGQAIFTSPDPADVRVETVIALKRGAPIAATESDDVYAAVGRSILAYFGVSDGIVPGMLSYPYDMPIMFKPRFDGSEILHVRRNLLAVDSLMESIAKKKQIEPATPRFKITVKEVLLADAVQGDIIPVTLQVTNLGDSPLIVHARPDCGCLSIDPASTIDGGMTALVKGAIDTTEFVGNLEKKLLISTNDPERPRLIVPVKVKVKPLYRFVIDGGRQKVADGDELTFDAKLWMAEGTDLKPLSVQLSGLAGTVAFTPWEGLAADPELGEGPLPRKGYKFSFKIPRPQLEGRFAYSVAVTTNHAKFSTLRELFSVQTGIVALPGSVYFGEVKGDSRRVSFLVSRPGRPFKVLKVDSDSPFVTGSATDVKEGAEYKISVVLNGNGASGLLNGSIRVHTDDPKQAIISVPFQAIAK